MSHVATTFHDIAVDSLGTAEFPSPIRRARKPGENLCTFVSPEARIREFVEFSLVHPPAEERLFESAGPREHLFFRPALTRCAVVTCGGLCPGLNNVIRSLFLELHFNYGVAVVLGIPYGYQGLDPSMGHAPIVLTPDSVLNIHHQGGTMLASSRGERDPEVMLNFLLQQRVDVLFCVGGDGTQRGAHAIAMKAKERGAKLAVVGIPKTIDNDLSFCDRTFGLVTAVEKAVEALDCAHVEAQGAPRGIGLVRLMGRDAGFIACNATLASQDVNYCLIPECPFELDGPRGLLEALRSRIDGRGHAVIAVAEGAGQHLFGASSGTHDASGNRRFQDIGVYLKDRITTFFKERNRPVELKYIDPSYMIRSAPANCDDMLLCDQLARHAAHAAMAGKTDVLICYKNGKFLHVPIPMAVAKKQQVELDGPLWASVLAATGQSARYGE